MMQKYRISTNIGQEQKVTFEIKQDYDLLEILSLKFSQKDVYTSLCADYGVVCGRISANNGLGIPNARVSIFVPQSNNDSLDPVISSFYPYTGTTDRNENNYRYNLLPSRRQHGGHTPTGTFVDQSDILSREEVLEVYEKYYNYTVKTNDAGDFMIWGVPLGKQEIHVDIDLSDIGCFSFRPYDFIKKGLGEDNFDRFYKFKSSSDIDGLPQIVSFDKTIEVYPFWGNVDLCQIGITRTDFDLSEKDIRIEPTTVVLASSITDNNVHAIKRDGQIHREMGFKCNLQTKSGGIECVRYTGKKVYSRDNTELYPELEYYKITETFDDDGSVMFLMPANLEYVYTNEFGEQEITNDKNKGVPTTSIARFRLSLDVPNPEGSNGIQTAKYLVPNLREYNSNNYGTNFRKEKYEENLATYQFSDIFEEYFNVTPPVTGMTINKMSSDFVQDKKNKMLGTNNNDVPEDYFYKFIFGKVYTVSSFQGSTFDGGGVNRFDSRFFNPLNPVIWWQQASYVNPSGINKDRFLGFKEIRPNNEDDCATQINYIPTNFAYQNRRKFSLILSEFLLFIQYVTAIVTNFVYEAAGASFYRLGRTANSIYFGWPFNSSPLKKQGEYFTNLAYKQQEKGTQTLPLVTYPDCASCTSDDDYIKSDLSSLNEYASVGEIKFKLLGIGEPNKNVILIPIAFNTATGENTSWLDEYYPSAPARDYDPTNEYTSGNTFSITGATGSRLDINTALEALHTGSIIPDSGDIDDSRFFGGVYSYTNDITGTSIDSLYYNVVPSNTGVTTSISFQEFLISFDNNNPDIVNKGYFRKEKYSNSNWDTLKTGIANYGNQIQNWVEVAGVWRDDPNGYIECLAWNHTQWSDLSGFNYDEGYTGGTNGADNYRDLGTFVIMKIFDRKYKKSNPTGTTRTDFIIEEGCAKYDKAYDEQMHKSFLWSSEGTLYGSSFYPTKPEDVGGPLGYDTTYYIESDGNPNNGTTITGFTIMSDIIGSASAQRLPRFVPYTKISSQYYDRRTKSGYSEIRDGIFTVIPVIRGGSYNARIITEWYRRKKVGMSFCGGVVNYSFIDNWLHGILYFFKFDRRLIWNNKSLLFFGDWASKYPNDIVFYNIFHKEFYYRSTPYNPTNGFTGQKGISNSRTNILHPTTFYDVGVRDTFFQEICTDPRLDPSCSVIRDLSNTSYQDPAKILEYAINYRLDISNNKFNVNDFFSITNIVANTNVLDGDITQLMSINCEAGIEAFDLDSPHYFIYNGETMDPEDPYYATYFKSGSQYSPVPIDFKFDINGSFVRGCLNYRLGDYSQTVPYYLWNKGGEGFGPYGANSDKQRWDKTKIISSKLQRISASNYIYSGSISDEEEYLLKPMTKTHGAFTFEGNTVDMLERFETISYSPPPTGSGLATNFTNGQLWLEVTTGSVSEPISGWTYTVTGNTWTKVETDVSGSLIPYVNGLRETYLFPTVNNYSGSLQVLSTPFMFYFGAKPNNTSLDKLIKYYGPKNEFPTQE